MGVFFSYIFVFFSGFQVLKLQAGVKGWFFSALVVEILAEPDGQMHEKHYEYLCFLKVPHFSIISYFRVLRITFDVVLAAFWVPGEANP